MILRLAWSGAWHLFWGAVIGALAVAAVKRMQGEAPSQADLGSTAPASSPSGPAESSAETPSA